VVNNFINLKNYFMKRIFLLALSCFVITSIYSQNIVKEHYTVSGGLLGAANFSEFRKPSANIDYNTKAGWSAGGWLNFPVSNVFSIEPQAMFSSYRYFTPSTASVLLKDGSIRYISVPLILKFNTGDHFAITAGPQVDFTASVENENGSTTRESDLKKTSFSAFGGLEIFPHGRVTVFGRYIYGFTNMSNATHENGGLEYKNQNVQAGLKIKLFGNKSKAIFQATTVTTPIVPEVEEKKEVVEEKKEVVTETPKPDLCAIDTDGDGVMDCNDKCPDVAGPASNNGCPEAQLSPEVNKILGGTGQAVYFSSNSAKLASTSNASLNKIVAVLKNNPDVKIKIEGHTDNAEKGDKMKISEDRANAVKAYLVSNGINEDQITTEGFGETMPIGDNNTAAGRTKNRRVEIKVKD
jgi:outer membrane protein OmpA-like peptidoglycan-associated protein